MTLGDIWRIDTDVQTHDQCNADCFHLGAKAHDDRASRAMAIILGLVDAIRLRLHWQHSTSRDGEPLERPTDISSHRASLIH